MVEHLDKNSRSHKGIGFVPTMGALHDGHLSLVERSKSDGWLTIASVFVNPAQFNNKEDLEKYPITTSSDIRMLVEAGCDILFLPCSAGEVFQPSSVAKLFDIGELESILEGAYRPGHFQGVCKVIDRFLTMIRPNRMYLGKKDLQQCLVIQKLIETTGSATRLTLCETKRTLSGLAMSSRNKRLSPEGLEKAVAISRSMERAKKDIGKKNIEAIEKDMRSFLLSMGFGPVDYCCVRRAVDLRPIGPGIGTTDMAILVAAFLEGVRLIDNIVIAS